MGSFDDFVEEKKPVEKTEDPLRSKIDEIDRVLEKREVQEDIADFEPVEPEPEKKSYLDKVKQKTGSQKKKIQEKREPKKDEEPEWTFEEKKAVKNKFIAKIKERKRVSRREKKRILGGEENPVVNSQKMVIGLAFVSMIFLFMFWQYNPANDAITAIVFMIGACLFLPLGAILGWMFMDPFMRCKIMRKMTKGRKNFGIVNFVGKSNKIITRIKNFDEDLIWIKNKCWALTKEGIYEIDKHGEQATDKQALDPDSFVTVTESVPTMFIDINSIQPLTLHESGRERIAPEELGSVLKGWVDNQMAKVMFLKRSLDLYFVIVILCSIASAYFGYANNQKIAELEETIKELGRQLQQMIVLPPYNFF